MLRSVPCARFFAYILLMFLENGNHLVNISRDIILKPEKAQDHAIRRRMRLKQKNCGHAVNVFAGCKFVSYFLGMNDIRQSPSPRNNEA